MPKKATKTPKWTVKALTVQIWSVHFILWATPHLDVKKTPYSNGSNLLSRSNME